MIDSQTGIATTVCRLVVKGLRQAVYLCYIGGMNYSKELKRWKKRRERAFDLWHSGIGFAEIGRRLKVTRQRAHQMVKKELNGVMTNGN